MLDLTEPRADPPHQADRIINQHRIQFRKQTVSSQHSPSGGFSPLFSNATSNQVEARQQVGVPTEEQKRSTQKRSEPDGDHHLKFVDLDDRVTG